MSNGPNFSKSPILTCEVSSPRLETLDLGAQPLTAMSSIKEWFQSGWFPAITDPEVSVQIAAE